VRADPDAHGDQDGDVHQNGDPDQDADKDEHADKDSDSPLTSVPPTWILGKELAAGAPWTRLEGPVVGFFP
jgi:hypothetical protein